MTRVLVEGWHSIPHSYAVVLRNQLRHWVGNPDVEFYFRQSPSFFDTAASPAPADDLSRAIDERVWRGEPVDCAYRVSFPYDVEPALPGLPTALFLTSEYQVLEPIHFRDGNVEALATACAAGRVLPITPSHWSANALSNRGITRFEVVPHGVDVDVFKPRTELATEAAKQLRRDLAGKFVFLTVGAMTQNKGIATLVRAFAIVRRAAPATALVLKGLRSLYESAQSIELAIKAAASSLLLSPHELTDLRSAIVILDDAVSERQLADLYAAADAYVTPYSAEGFNLPALEALACGLPVLHTAGGPTDEFIPRSLAAAYPIEAKLLRAARGNSRLVVSESALVAQMRRVIDARPARTAATESAIAHVRQEFTWPLAASRTLRALERLRGH